MLKHATRCIFAALATLAAAESSDQADECPKQAGSEVVIEALRFSDGRSYAYRVTNNGTSPIYHVTIGLGGDTFIEGSYATEPVSMGSPRGWEGLPIGVVDTRKPGSHEPVLTKYHWNVEDLEVGIQPGRSLSGFSVQLPTPREAELAYVRFSESIGALREPIADPPFAERLPPQPDLAGVHFIVRPFANRCDLVGTIKLDRGWGADAPDS